MQLQKPGQMALLAVASLSTFAIGIVATSCVIGSDQAPPQAPTVLRTPAPSILLGYAREHPDPAVSGPFTDKLKSGEIKSVLEKPREHAMASFGLRKDGYVLTIDPERLTKEPTTDEVEAVLSILSHEHAHYLQYVEGEMFNYHPRDGRPMTEAQCTLTILVEIDAHGKACRDARTYGWKSATALSSCDRTQATIAGFFLRERLATRPECKGVWEFYAGRASAEPQPKVRTRSEPPTRKRAGAIYMPPP